MRCKSTWGGYFGSDLQVIFSSQRKEKLPFGAPRSAGVELLLKAGIFSQADVPL